MLAHDIVELEHAVGCVSGHGQLARICLLAGAAKKFYACCLYLAGRENPAHPTFGQRSLNFHAKVVRVYQGPDGRTMAGLQTVRGRLKAPVRRAAEAPSESPYIN